MNKELLKKLCHEHPNAFIKTPDSFIPIRSELFPFPHVKTILVAFETNKFKIETNLDFPVILTLNDAEIESFNLFYDHLLGFPIDIWDKNEELQIKFIQTVSYIVGDEKELEKILSDTGFNQETASLEFWYLLYQQGVPISIYYEVRHSICRSFIEANLKNELDEKDLETICEYYKVTLGEFEEETDNYSSYRVVNTAKEDKEYRFTRICNSRYFIVEENENYFDLKTDLSNLSNLSVNGIIPQYISIQRCEYVFTRGINKGEKCNKEVINNTKFCENCLKRNAVKNIIKSQNNKIYRKDTEYVEIKAKISKDFKVYKQIINLARSPVTLRPVVLPSHPNFKGMYRDSVHGFNVSYADDTNYFGSNPFVHSIHDSETGEDRKATEEELEIAVSLGFSYMTYHK